MTYLSLKSIFIAALLTVNSLAHAQVDVHELGKAMDYLNCKVVEYSLIASPTRGVTRQFREKCNCDAIINHQTIFDAIPRTEIEAIRVSAEIQKIKESEFILKLTYSEAINFITEGIFMSENENSIIVDFAEKQSEKGKFQEFQSNLKKVVPKFFNVAKDEILAGNDETQLERRISSIELTINKKKDWFDGITFQFDVFSILISLILGIIAALFILKHYAYEDSNMSEKRSLRSPNNTVELNAIIQRLNILENASKLPLIASDTTNDNRDLFKRIEYLEKEINNVLKSLNTSSNLNDFFKRIDYLEKHIKILTDNLAEIKTLTDHNKLPGQKIAEEFPVPEKEIFYLSTPNIDGSFNNSSASVNYRDSASIYRFTKISKSVANFQIDEKEASVKLALQFPDKNIDPVCDAVNSFNSKANTIFTTEAGKAELVGEKWIIIYKSKIRYGN